MRRYGEGAGSGGGPLALAGSFVVTGGVDRARATPEVMPTATVGANGGAGGAHVDRRFSVLRQGAPSFPAGRLAMPEASCYIAAPAPAPAAVSAGRSRLWGIV